MRSQDEAQLDRFEQMVETVAVPVRSRLPGALLVDFRKVAVRLGEVAPEMAASAEEGHEAATALFALADDGDEQSLRQVLRPDPTQADVAWTVACYRIGDLTPSELRDFSSAVDAVGGLRTCDDPSHVAAELVASTAEGIRWTAIFRTGEHATFQLVDPRTATRAAAGSGSQVAEAAEHWRQQLARWAEDPHVDLPVQELPLDLALAADLAATDTTEAMVGAVLQALVGLGQRLDAGRQDAEQLALRLERIEQRLDQLVARLDQPAPRRTAERTAPARSSRTTKGATTKAASSDPSAAGGEPKATTKRRRPASTPAADAG